MSTLGCIKQLRAMSEDQVTERCHGDKALHADES
jgi:hypothetical protein